MSNQSKPTEAAAASDAAIDSPRYLTAPKICHNLDCSFQTHEPLSRCPKCGRPIWTTNEFRVISSVLIFCGLFLSIVGGGLIFIFAGVVSNTDASRGTTFKGGEAMAIFIFGIFGVILSFGLSVLAAGLWQVIFGRANRRLIYILLTILLVLMLIVGFGQLILVLLSEN
jgi:lysylphosphatidylglycerol synthetase-like protein (DUF2156 family)